MAPSMPGGRWATGLLVWLGMVLSATAQSPADTNGLFPFSTASIALDTSEESQPQDVSTPGANRVVPAPILVPLPSAGPPAAQPPSVSQAVPPPQRWPLMRALQGTWLGVTLEDERLQIYGWTQGNFTASTDRTSNLPYGMNYKANQFLLEQNWLRIDRAVVTSGTSEPSFGYRLDCILPGSDYFFTVPRGIPNGPGLYGIDPVEFYVEAYFPSIAQGFDVKVGRFFSLFGVEVIPAVDNPLVSHAYAFIYNPFTQTGIVTTTKFSNAISAQAGLVMGNDNIAGATAYPTFIGNIKWVNPDQRNSLLLNIIADRGRFDQVHNFHNPEIVDLIATHKINSGLLYTFEGLYGFTTNVPDIGFANWMSIVNYLTLNVTDQVSTAARLELFDDFQGQRTGFPGLYVAPAGVVAYRPVKWLQWRQEIRYDYHTETAPFEGKHGLFTATTDFIVRW
jgi:hypothetical protein